MKPLNDAVIASEACACGRDGCFLLTQVYIERQPFFHHGANTIVPPYPIGHELERFLAMGGVID